MCVCVSSGIQIHTHMDRSKVYWKSYSLYINLLRVLFELFAKCFLKSGQTTTTQRDSELM